MEKHIGIYAILLLNGIIAGTLLYHAQDVGCDPSPIGLSGVGKIMFIFLSLSFASFMAGRNYEK